MIADLRADLHNTSAREYKRSFSRSDFLPAMVGKTVAQRDTESRIRELVAQGMSPASAAAAVHSTQTPQQKLHILQGGRKG